MAAARKTDARIRAHISRLLAWGDAHATFDAAVKGLPPRRRGVIPAGLEHSAWQLVEHLRLAQADILEFCTNPRYKAKAWPDEYWPRSPAPHRLSAWTTSVTAFRADRRSLQKLAPDARVDLLAAIPWGEGQTYLRELRRRSHGVPRRTGDLRAPRAGCVEMTRPSGCALRSMTPCTRRRRDAPADYCGGDVGAAGPSSTTLSNR